ncbi:MAG TPA: hypothetical protein VHE30_21385 [Polyangiaceae bacterium]|nr:hypothetical protein [Polyangiaceae bacterium]
MSTKESQKALKEAIEELSAARETAKLKAHLFSLDAKRAWEDLEREFTDLRQKIEAQGEQVVETSAASARDLARSIRKLVEKQL